MNQKRSIFGSKIDFRVWQSYHFLYLTFRQYTLLDFKERYQAIPSIANSLPAKLPIAQYGSSPNFAPGNRTHLLPWVNVPIHLFFSSCFEEGWDKSARRRINAL